MIHQLDGQKRVTLVDPVDSTIHFESVKAEIDGGTELYDGFVIMASWLPDFVNRGDGGLKVRRREPAGSERSMFLSWGRGRECAPYATNGQFFVPSFSVFRAKCRTAHLMGREAFVGCVWRSGVRRICPRKSRSRKNKPKERKIEN